MYQPKGKYPCWCIQNFKFPQLLNQKVSGVSLFLLVRRREASLPISDEDWEDTRRMARFFSGASRIQYFLKGSDLLYV